MNLGAVESQDLHHFSDATDVGYGQCSYLRSVNQSGGVHCALICNKARVIADMQPVYGQLSGSLTNNVIS